MKSGYGVVAQCPACSELLPPGSIPSVAYIQPVGQVCFPAVIQIPDNTPKNPPQPTPPRDEDDDYLNLIYLLISTLTGSNKCNSNSNTNLNSNNNGRNTNNPNNNGASPIYNPFSTLIPNSGSKNSGPNCGCIDISSLINGPFSYTSPSSAPTPGSNINPNPITISIDTSAGTSCICEPCNANNPFANLNLFPGFLPGLGYGASSGQNNNAPTPSYIPDSFNAGNGCIYVPYPVPVPYNVPGYSFDDICYPENDYEPQEIKLIINTQCD